MPHQDQMMPDEGQEAAPTKTVYIEMAADGSLTVGLKSEMDMMGGMEEGMEGMEGAPEGAEPGMKPAASIDEALQMARQLLEGDQGSPEEQVMAGYTKSKPMMGRAMAGRRQTPEQVFGE